MPSRTTRRSITASIAWAFERASFGGSSATSITSPVDPGADQALATDRGEDVEMRPLSASDQGGQDDRLAALAGPEHSLDDLLGDLAADRPVALRAMRQADPGVEQSEIVVDLGQGRDRAPGVDRAGFLIDRDGRRQALDGVDVGRLGLVEELAGITGEGFQKPSTALGVDRVERQAALARPADAGERDQPTPRDIDIHRLEVVDPSGPDRDDTLVLQGDKSPDPSREPGRSVGLPSVSGPVRLNPKPRSRQAGAAPEAGLCS